jgi:hypothetical protein
MLVRTAATTEVLGLGTGLLRRNVHLKAVREGLAGTTDEERVIWARSRSNLVIAMTQPHRSIAAIIGIARDDWQVIRLL